VSTEFDCLELTPWCYVIDGAWSQLLVVDKDLLRGSGRGLSEAFGVHLGIHSGVA